MASNTASNGRNSRFLVFVLIIILASLLDFIGSLSYYFNFEGKNIFVPYYSDRNILPFPLLFPEFDLSSLDSSGSNRGTINTHDTSTNLSFNRAIKSGRSSRNRGADEMCYRRLLLEYEQYRLNDSNIFENIPKRGFVAPRDSPPGWLSYTSIDKLILNLLDAYRFDYVVYDPVLSTNKKDVRNIYRNKMDSFYSLFSTDRRFVSSYRDRDKCRLYKLISFYPTLTVFAVKSIMSGDTRNVGMVAGNLNPTDLKLDHLPHQCHSNNLELNLLGDVTSYDLASNCFKTHITNKHKNTVNDIYNADQMVYDNYKKFLDSSDCLILHLVGADHLSHCGGRNTHEMSSIMSNYDKFVKELMEEVKSKKNYMIFFFGDHGQKESGIHGDDTVEEMETFLLAYSDLKLNQEEKRDYCPLSETPTGYRLDHSVLNGQVEEGFSYGHQYTQDLCTTAALLLNVPIPFHSEGFVIPTAVPRVAGPDGRELTDKFLVQLHHVNVHHLLRIIDLLAQNHEVKFNARQYRWIMRKRLELANLYTLLRLVDTTMSKAAVGGVFSSTKAGTSVFSTEALAKLYANYSALCKQLSTVTARLVKESTRSFTFHYLYVCIIIKYVAIVMLVYCLVGTLRFYRFPSLAVGERQAGRLGATGHPKNGAFAGDDHESSSAKADRDMLVRRVLARLLRALLASLALSFLFGSHFKLVLPDELPLVSRLLPKGSFSLTLSWPVGVFKGLLLLAQRYTRLLSKFFVIEEYNIYLHFSVLYSSLLTLFLLYDAPLLFRGYMSLLGFQSAPKIESCSSALKTFYYNLGRYSLRKLTTLLYCVVFFLVVVSECALYSHDTISRHLFVIFMLIETAPFLLRGNYLSKQVRNRLLLLFGLVKFSSFFHDYRLFFFAADPPSPSWIIRQNFLNLFELSMLSLLVFYALLLRVFRTYHNKQLSDCRNNFEFSIVCCANAIKRKRLLLFGYTLSFLCVLLNYALTTQSSLLGMHKFIHNLHNAYNMKMFVASLFAWGALLLFVLTLLGLAVNPFNMFFDSKPRYALKYGSVRVKGSLKSDPGAVGFNAAAVDTYRFSSFILYLIPQMCLMIFLICGQKKSFQTLIGFVILYHTCFILTCKNSNFYLSHALLLQTVADVIYFAAGSFDKLQSLNFQTGFIFVSTYYRPISDPTVLFDTMSLHMLFSMVLIFSYFNSASLRYDLQSSPGDTGCFDLDTLDKFRSYVESFDARSSSAASSHDKAAMGSGSSQKPISRKTFTLRKIIHVIALFIFLVSVLGFSVLLTIMKLHLVPCIALRSFPKALFLLARSTAMFVTLLALFVMRALM